MPIVCPDASEVVVLKRILNKTSTGDPVLHLFSNNHTPGESTVVGNLTEVTAAGYAAVTLTGASWTVGTSGGVTTGNYAAQTFTFTTSTTVYGAYITSIAGELMWLEKFTDGPYNIPGGGGTVAVTPIVTLD